MPLFDNPEIAKHVIRGMGTQSTITPKEAAQKCECGGVLIMTNPHITYADPPRKRTVCRDCKQKSWVPVDEYPQGIGIVESICAATGEDITTLSGPVDPEP